MGKIIPALVTPQMLRWAREEAGYSPEAAASHVKVPVEKLLAWESGELQPTLGKAESLAAFYQCAYSLFCMASPPATKPLAAERRRLPGVLPGEESPELRFALRQMLQQRRLALWLADELGEDIDPFAFKIHFSEDPESIAAKLRKKLAVPIDVQKAWRDEFQAWRVWREAVEHTGVLVFQFYKVQPEEARGLCLLDFPAPVIGVNSKEIPASKPFTLLHEFVHLALANAREEHPAIAETRSEKEWIDVERFAEEVTGAVLLPRDDLLAESAVSKHRAAALWTLDDIRHLARRYKVTPLALITRLSRIGKCDPGPYKQWKAQWAEYLKLHPPKSSGGIATPAQKAVNRNGQPYTRLVLEALSRDRITALDAARYLNLRYPHVESLRRDFAFGVATYYGENSGAA